jgi:hypothetical protein
LKTSTEMLRFFVCHSLRKSIRNMPVWISDPNTRPNDVQSGGAIRTMTFYF